MVRLPLCQIFFWAPCSVCGNDGSVKQASCINMIAVVVALSVLDVWHFTRCSPFNFCCVLIKSYMILTLKEKCHTPLITSHLLILFFLLHHFKIILNCSSCDLSWSRLSVKDSLKKLIQAISSTLLCCRDLNKSVVDN